MDEMSTRLFMFSTWNWSAARWLCGSRPRLYVWNGPGDYIFLRDSYVIAVMQHLQERAVKKLVGCFFGCHLDAQAAVAEQEMESESCDALRQARCEGE